MQQLCSDHSCLPLCNLMLLQRCVFCCCFWTNQLCRKNPTQGVSCWVIAVPAEAPEMEDSRRGQPQPCTLRVTTPSNSELVLGHLCAWTRSGCLNFTLTLPQCALCLRFFFLFLFLFFGAMWQPNYSHYIASNYF